MNDLPDPFANIQTVGRPTPRVLRRQAREAARQGLKRETLAELIPQPPEPGVCLHVVSNGQFDYFTFLPLILGWTPGQAEVYASTWTMNRANVTDLLAFCDAGRIARLAVASGNYFIKRESAVAATLWDGLRKRNHRFTTWENHTKVLLVHIGPRFWVVEGSANWTANPRTEQNILLDHEDVYRFHAGWLEDMFKRHPAPKYPEVARSQA